MSLIAEHLFNPKSRQRLRADIQRILEEGRRELKQLLRIQHRALRLPLQQGEDRG